MHDPCSSCPRPRPFLIVFFAGSYTADGKCLLGGGQSKWVVLYDVEQRLLLRKWQLSHNRSLDGVLDKLHTSGMAGDAGASVASFDLDASDDDDDEKKGKEVLPGAATGEFSKRNNKVRDRERERERGREGGGGGGG